MRNAQHNLSVLKHELYNQKRKNTGKKEFICRKLTSEQVEYVSNFCVVEPYLYEVRRTFRPGFDVRNASGIVKCIFYAKKSVLYKTLSAKEVALCKSAGLKVIPYKYKIYLNTLK